MLTRLFRPFGLIPMSEYDVVYRWYEEKRDECQRWEARVEVLESQRDDLSDRLMARAADIEAIQLENGKLWAQLREAQAEANVWRSKYEDMQTEVQQAEKPAPRRKKTYQVPQ